MSNSDKPITIAKELVLRCSDKVALVDSEDFERLSKFKWYVVIGNGKGISISRSFHVRTLSNKTKSVRLSNEIMNRNGILFDHKDRNPFNNQKSNLREATRSQNGMNRGMMSNNTSGYKGVFKHGYSWRAIIVCEGKRFSIGTFKLKIDAAKAYNKFAIELFKEFAILNKDDKGEVL